jgi:hypothetical protein
LRAGAALGTAARERFANRLPARFRTTTLSVAAETPAAGNLRPRLVHREAALTYLDRVQLADRFLRFLVGANFHERKIRTD